MEKELSDNAPPFEALVDDVARTMGSCGSPNRTFSMMDEYTAEMDEAGCYVNPFVGEGRYARYLRLWLGMVPKRQMMILNFDVWTASDAAAKATMAEVAGFLQLAHFAFRVSEAHNTHANRSVHVDRDAVTDAAQIKAQAVEAELSTRIRCILNDFFQPFNEDLDHLLAHYGYSPMTHTWQSGSGCPPESLWRFAEVLLAAPHAGEVSREDEEHKKCGTVDHPCLAGSDFHVNY
uniref:Uncharacterized protein n=1 Tax=Strombidinopsis acuminata TaxID=141414 RepID=A0A7S3RFK0_9SPIT